MIIYRFDWKDIIYGRVEIEASSGQEARQTDGYVLKICFTYRSLILTTMNDRSDLPTLATS